MKTFLHQTVAILCTLSLCLPSPSFAFKPQAARQSNAQSGLEESLKDRFATAPPTSPRTGLEEGWTPLEKARPQLAGFVRLKKDPTVTYKIVMMYHYGETEDLGVVLLPDGGQTKIYVNQFSEYEYIPPATGLEETEKPALAPKLRMSPLPESNTWYSVGDGRKLLESPLEQQKKNTNVPIGTIFYTGTHGTAAAAGLALAISTPIEVQIGSESGVVEGRSHPAEEWRPLGQESDNFFLVSKHDGSITFVDVAGAHRDDRSRFLDLQKNAIPGTVQSGLEEWKVIGSSHDSSAGVVVDPAGIIYGISSISSFMLTSPRLDFFDPSQKKPVVSVGLIRDMASTPIRLAETPAGIVLAPDPDLNLLFISQRVSGEIIAVDLKLIRQGSSENVQVSVQDFPPMIRPGALAYNPDRRLLYVAEDLGNNESQIRAFPVDKNHPSSDSFKIEINGVVQNLGYVNGKLYLSVKNIYSPSKQEWDTILAYDAEQGTLIGELGRKRIPWASEELRNRHVDAFAIGKIGIDDVLISLEWESHPSAHWNKRGVVIYDLGTNGEISWSEVPGGISSKGGIAYHSDFGVVVSVANPVSGGYNLMTLPTTNFHHISLGEYPFVSAGLEEGIQQALASAVEAWGQLSVKPSIDLTTRPMPVFYPGTYHAIPLAAKGNLSIVILVNSQREEQGVRALLEGLEINRRNALFYHLDEFDGDAAAAFQRVREDFPEHKVYPVDPLLPTWLSGLMTWLQDAGVGFSVDNASPALEATAIYFERLA